MTTKQIIALQERIGTKPDGEWGPKSAEACRQHLLKLMPKVNPWPSPDDESMLAFYGAVGNEDALVSINVAHLGIKYDGKKVSTIRCHKKVAMALLETLEEIASGPAAWILAQYGGCYSFRRMRGGQRYSKHAWGAAIDLAPNTNGLRSKWPQSSDMPIEAMEAFAKRGAVSAGAFWNRDGMHHEFTKPS